LLSLIGVVSGVLFLQFFDLSLMPSKAAGELLKIFRSSGLIAAQSEQWNRVAPLLATG